jgi:NitT/TauT family transport system ATP-binding protein
LSRGARRVRAEGLLASMGLADFADSYPYQLSQGMRQRVSLARTLAPDPSLLLMDEPFSALDAQTRQDVQEWFLEIWEREQKTVLFVTHDLEEAILLADRIIVMTGRPGRIHVERVVPLPRPRGELARWLFEPSFRSFHEELWHDLQDASRNTATDEPTRHGLEPDALGALSPSRLLLEAGAQR